MSSIDWDVWTVDPEDPREPGRITCRKCVDLETGRSIEFVIDRGRIEPSTVPDGPDYEAAFDSFSIDGREPTEEEQDEHYDALRGIVWDTFTET